MALRNLSDDREAQATTFDRVIRGAMKALKDAAALGSGYARTLITYFQLDCVVAKGKMDREFSPSQQP